MVRNTTQIVEAEKGTFWIFDWFLQYHAEKSECPLFSKLEAFRTLMDVLYAA